MDLNKIIEELSLKEQTSLVSELLLYGKHRSKRIYNIPLIAFANGEKYEAFSNEECDEMLEELRIRVISHEQVVQKLQIESKDAFTTFEAKNLRSELDAAELSLKELASTLESLEIDSNWRYSSEYDWHLLPDKQNAFIEALIRARYPVFQYLGNTWVGL